MKGFIISILSIVAVCILVVAFTILRTSYVSSRAVNPRYYRYVDSCIWVKDRQIAEAYSQIDSLEKTLLSLDADRVTIINNYKKEYEKVNSADVVELAIMQDSLIARHRRKPLKRD